MGVVTALAVASLAVAAIGTAASIDASQKAASQQKKGQAIAQSQNSVNQANTIRDQVRAARVKTAQIAQSSSDTGVTGSSGQSGSSSALQAQTGANVGTITGAGLSNTAIQGTQQKAANDQSSANTYNAIAGIGERSFSIFSQTPQFKQATSNIF